MTSMLITPHNGPARGTPSRHFSASTSRSVVQSHHNTKVQQALENTYHLEPSTDFPTAAVRKVIIDTLEGHIQEKKYSAEECNKLTTDITNTVKSKVKCLGTKRYKIVVLVMMGQQDKSSMTLVSRCIWNENFDTYVEETHKNGSIFATCLVYGIYAD